MTRRRGGERRLARPPLLGTIAGARESVQSIMRRRAVVLTGLGAVACFFGVAVVIQYPSYRRAKRDVERGWNGCRFATVVSAELHRGDGTRLDLGRLVSLPWDRVYVLAPYTAFESARGAMPGPWYPRDHDG